MDKLLSDSAKTEISNKVMDIIRAYHISNWHSEPYHQNQNPAEWRYKTIRSWTNTVMNRSGAPANCWLLCLIYVCYLLNHIACTALDGKIPLLALTGITPDISIILLFTLIQIGKEANIMFKLNGRLGRLLLNPSPSLLLMTQSPVQHIPRKMIYLLEKDGVGSETLPRMIKSLQEQSSKVRSGKSGDLKLTCLGTTSPETTWKPCNLTQKTKTANGMMPLSLRWNPCQNTKYSKSGIKQSLINIRKSKTLLKVIIGL